MLFALLFFFSLFFLVVEAHYQSLKNIMLDFIYIEKKIRIKISCCACLMYN